MRMFFDKTKRAKAVSVVTILGNLPNTVCRNKVKKFVTKGIKQMFLSKYSFVRMHLC